MNRFLLRILRFALPAAVAAVGAEWGLRSIPHQLAYKARYMEEHAPQIEVLSLGLSHAFYGLDFHASKFRGFNLAYHGQPLDRDLELWEKYADRLTSLRAVTVPLSCWSIHHRLRKEGEQWRVPFYTINYDLSAPWYAFKERCIIAYPAQAFRYLKHALASEDSLAEGNIPQDEFGSYMARLDNRHPDWDQRAAEDVAKNHSRFKPDDMTHNREVLRHIAADCAERGIRVVLYTPPAWHTYYEHLSEEIVSLTREIGTSLAREFPNVRYVDLLKDRRFTADDFFNASHLNYDRGGRKLIRILDDEIAEDPLPAK